jgi:hypothetical protein
MTPYAKAHARLCRIKGHWDALLDRITAVGNMTTIDHWYHADERGWDAILWIERDQRLFDSLVHSVRDKALLESVL